MLQEAMSRNVVVTDWIGNQWADVFAEWGASTIKVAETTVKVAQAMAVEILKSHPNQDPKTIAVAIFRQLVTRPPEETEIQDLLEFQKKQLQRLLDGELVPNQIAGQVIPANYKLQEVAAWVMLARAIMNIDEVITKP